MNEQNPVFYSEKITLKKGIFLATHETYLSTSIIYYSIVLKKDFHKYHCSEKLFCSQRKEKTRRMWKVYEKVKNSLSRKVLQWFR